MRRAWVAVLVLAAAPTVAEGQIFLASRPSPEFTIGPLFVLANVTPELHAVTVDVLWSLVIPPAASDLDRGRVLGPDARAVAHLQRRPTPRAVPPLLREAGSDHPSGRRSVAADRESPRLRAPENPRGVSQLGPPPAQRDARHH